MSHSHINSSSRVLRHTRYSTSLPFCAEGPKEVLLELLPPKCQTRVVDITDPVLSCMGENPIPLTEIMSIVPDGA